MKNLKYLFISLSISSLLFSCQDSLEDTYEELGALETPIKSDINYTLTEDDYENIDPNSEDDIYQTENAFPSFDDAISKIPNILYDELPRSEGAKVLLNINVFNQYYNQIEAFNNASEIELVSADYPTNNSQAFLPSEDASGLIPVILSNKVSSPTEGDFVKVTYKNYTEEPVISGSAAEFDFTNETFNGWTSVNVTGDQEWIDVTGFGNISMNGYDDENFENEDWLVSPEIDLAGKSDLKFKIQENLRYGTDLSLLKILVSENYSGDINTATWNELTIPNRAYHTTHNLEESSTVDFSAYDGKTIHLAFKYNSTTTDSSRWLIGKTTIFNENTEEGELEGPTEELTAYFNFNGDIWEAPDNFYTLSTEDYDAMGTSSNTPGQYNNFSSSVSPGDYLPAFLNSKFAYAKDGDSKFVFYKYFSGSVQDRFDIYTFTNGTWSAPEITTLTEIRFKFKNGSWVSDNATRYEFVTADYEAVVEGLADNTELEPKVGNLDNYGNFNRQGSSTSWTDEDLLFAFDVVLKTNFPEAETGQQYIVTIETYQGGYVNQEFAVELSEAGNYIYTE